jgi:choline dehydrogenase
LGNAGWSYEEVLPYFIRSENNDQCHNTYHGQNGPLNVTHLKHFSTPLTAAFIDAARNVGIPTNADYNGASQSGAFRFQFTQKDGMRHSSATAFLKPVLERPNLTVVTQAQATRIHFAKDRTVGLSFEKNGNEQRVDCKREVLLSAGAFNSPHLLLLSGVGPKDQLQKHGIECVQELPGVGENLQDHLFFPVAASARGQVGINHYLKPLPKLWQALRYMTMRKGPFTTGPLVGGAFLNSEDIMGPVNFQFQFTPFHIGPSYDYDMYDLKSYPRYDGFTLLPSLINPKSKGRLYLQSSDPKAPPLIDPNFLSDPADLDQMVRGAKIGIKLLQQDAFAPYLKDWELLMPDSDEEMIREHIIRTVETIYHPSCTCKMGQDEMAVVDERLHVRGLSGLRVVDASIMPKVISGNTNAPVFMIAEKAADMILEDR